MSEINSFLSPKAKKEIEWYEKQLGKMVDQYGKLDKAIAALNREIQKEEKTTKKLNAAQKEAQRQKNALNKVNAQLAASGTKLNRQLIRQQEKHKAATKAMREQERAALGIKKTNRLFKSVTKSIVAASVAMVGFRTVLNVFKNSIKTIASFEEAMSKVKAVSGALPREFKALTANAKKLGSTTSKTASEVAGLQLEFSKLGFSTKEILAATEATISLSIAAGSDLAESAVVAASTVRGFGLDAEETQRVVDVMAKSFSSSALDLEKFKTAMATAAPVAKASGKSIEFTTAQLSILSDAGLDASTAGTSLRNMFLELTKKGLTWEQGLAKINNSTDKAKTGLELFGKRGVTAGLILADNVKKANDLEEAYEGAAGAAKEMADIMEDNLIGDTKKLSSAWEGFILSMNSGDGVLSKVLRKSIMFLKEIVGHMEYLNTTASQRMQDWSDSFATKEIAKFEKKLNDVNLTEQERLELKKEELELQSRLLISNARRIDALDDEARAARDKKTKNNILEEIALRRKLQIGQQNYVELLRALNVVKKEEEEETTTQTQRQIQNTDRIIAKTSELNEAWQKVIEFYGVDMATAIKEGADEFEKIYGAANRSIIDDSEQRLEEQKQIEEEYTEAVKQEEEARRMLRQQSFAMGVDLVNALFSLQQSKRDAELSSLDSEYDARIKRAEGNEELQERLEKERAQKAYKIQLESAKAEKQAAIFNILASTAQGAAQIAIQAAVLASNPVTAGLAPLAYAQLGLLAATSAVQIAAVNQAPLPQPPQFALGTDYSPSTFIAGEAGRELMIGKDGTAFLTPNHASLYTGMEGTQIIPNAQTESIMRMVGTGDIGTDAIIGSKLDEIKGAILDSKTSISLDKSGAWRVSQRNQAYNTRRNRKLNIN